MARWTVAGQAPLSMGFSRQEYWSGLPCPSTGDLPNPGIKHRSLSLKADSLPFELLGKPMRNYARKSSHEVLSGGSVRRKHRKFSQ